MKFIGLWLLESLVPLLVILILFSRIASAQVDSTLSDGNIKTKELPRSASRNVGFFEAGGIGGIYSFNYEHAFAPIGSNGNPRSISLRMGLSIINGFVLPMSVHYNLKSGTIYYSVGVGLTSFFLDIGTPIERFNVYYSPIFGARFFSKKKSFFVQISYCPILSNEYELGKYQDTYVIPWGGLGIGLRL